jgi:hypothetical protein
VFWKVFALGAMIVVAGAAATGIDVWRFHHSQRQGNDAERVAYALASALAGNSVYGVADPTASVEDVRQLTSGLFSVGLANGECLVIDIARARASMAVDAFPRGVLPDPTCGARRTG